MRMPADLNEGTLWVDSFLFQARGRFRDQPGQEWEHYLPRKEFLASLAFRLEERSEGTRALTFTHTTSTPMATEKYPVLLDHTPCRQGGRWWFRCPGHDGKPCGGRVRFLYLGRDHRRFACRRCAGVHYESQNRNHDPLFTGFLKPAEALRSATRHLLRCRSPERRAFLEEKAESARQRIRHFFEGRWRRIASRVVTGRAGVRDRQYFDELVDRLVGSDVLHFVEAAMEGLHGEEVQPSLSTAILTARLFDGAAEIEEWEESLEMFRYIRRPQHMTRLVLVALASAEIRRYLVGRGVQLLGALAEREHTLALAQDPEALLAHMRLMARVERSDAPLRSDALAERKDLGTVRTLRRSLRASG